MPIVFGICDKCEAKIKPLDQYAILKIGKIYCLKCGEEAESQHSQVLAWRTAKEPEKKKGKKQ